MGSAEQGRQEERAGDILLPRGIGARILSALASAVLRSQRAHDEESWQHGCRRGYEDGWKKGNHAGYTLGLEKGLEKGQEVGALVGHQQGLSEGIEAGKRIIELRPGRAVQAQGPQVDHNLFANWRFPITPEVEREIRDRVAEHLSGQEPTDDQWKMIFSRDPSTCIVAGAGSGKSTTMVLRLLVLHKYLGIPKERIAVVTFTRESRKDFRRKLAEVFALWGVTLTEEVTGRIVRTFHSRILDFIRCSQPHAKVTAFEFFSISNTEDEEGNEVENALDIRLTTEQLDLMNAAYQHVYETNETFQGLIAQLVRASAKPLPLSPNSAEARKRVGRILDCSKRDEELTDAVDRLWRAAGAWPIEGIEAGPFPVTLKGLTFFANGYCEELKAYVILGVGSNDRKLCLQSMPWMKLTGATTMKKTLFQVYCDKGILFLDNYAEGVATLDALRGYVRKCPKFEYELEGELGEAPVMQAFHSTASFLENLGLDVTDAVRNMSFTQKSTDAIFFHALAIFWPAFNDYLASQSPPIFTFNKMFEMFGERGAANLEQLPDEIFMPMLHLLVDEFQDCGANTISWLRAVFREARHRGLSVTTDTAVYPASLMAVGDDWQSIYGWRGSSPKFFENFESYFPSPSTTHVLMKENYRSQQMVIDAAESLVQSITTNKDKHGIAAHPKVKDLAFPVQVLDRDDNQLADLVEQHFDKGQTVLVLYRKNDTKKEVRIKLSSILAKARKLKRASSIKLLTYHGSKGLEADAVLLVGDCAQMSTSPHRNMAYEQARLGEPGDPAPYDTAQGQETLRLAYVAITRAKRHCYWFVELAKPAKGGLVSALARVRFQHPYFEDLRNR
ncbi:UvrD-helicase domain-containing protein [Pseudomonas sp. 10S4]|uniref:UvrD-helicase domain-containing protein n=1 Tax=Pseudomonas sp. 10S4 TaxID=3048583 RepID=UPI002B226109|nr:MULTISPECIES: UvrD-helicase domain-containing protein [unclassified Pseudomonas]MEB0227901.1 UvrD-helicase domain-containing protein [Pseudomonas sp. 5S1]MEB0293085.1 UvrD-helicase domain-containing protein [Pseudomonas sp. 10S4]